MDAVDHSWSWTGGRPLETFDRDVQDHLLVLVRTRGLLIDVGCNVGVMTLSVLLRDPSARAVCIDPNTRAIRLLADSLKRNHCSDRAVLINAALSARETTLSYDADGSFTGHVSPGARAVRALPFPQLVKQHVTGAAVLKIDVEGYESQLAESLVRVRLPAGSVALLELHPEGFNGMGAPRKILSDLENTPHLRVHALNGRALTALDPTQFHQLEIAWPE